MKRIIALILALACVISCFGCAGSQTPAETTETTEATKPAFSQAAKEKLDGKKVLIVGNS